MLKSNTERILEILNENKYTDFEKAGIINRNVEYGNLDLEETNKYLRENYPKIMDEVFWITNKNIKRKMPYPKSALDWGEDERIYYNINITDINDETFTPLNFELTSKAKLFLEECSKLSLSFLSSMTLEKVVEYENKFITACFMVTNTSNDECRVDELVKLFFEGILDGKKFLTLGRHTYDLKVGKSIKKSIPDVNILYVQQTLWGIIIIQDKTKEGDELRRTELQAVAQAIAVSQQKNYPDNTPIYFFIVKQYYITAYRAIFSKNYCRQVENGEYIVNPVKIERYLKKNPNKIGPNGLSLVDKEDREKAARIICEIQANFQSLMIN